MIEKVGMVDEDEKLEAIASFMTIVDQFSGKEGLTDLTFVQGGAMSVRLLGKFIVQDLPDSITVHFESIVEYLSNKYDFKENRSYLECIDIGTRKYRTKILKQYRGFDISLRPLDEKIRGAEELNIPIELVNRFSRFKSGLVIVCGPTGSGKSSTIRTMVRDRSEQVGGKYITLERPIEGVYSNTDKAIFCQREVGRDVGSFSEGLEDSLHQDPDVIVVQELVDSKSVQTALQAGLTGHLVVGTLHACEVHKVPQRLAAMVTGEGDLGWTPSHAVEMVASAIQMIVSQLLLPGPRGRMCPIFEVLHMQDNNFRRSYSVENLIKENNWQALRQELDMGTRDGVYNFGSSYSQRVEDGLVNYDSYNINT